MPDSQQDSGGSRPIPDPTVLTTEASIRLEGMLRNLIRTEGEHLHELLVVEIQHQHELFSEKLAKYEMRFDVLDARTAEQKSDTKAALDAALAAQKEAVASQTESANKSIDKSETATTERIKGVEALLATTTKATDDKIGDLKDRVIAIEAVKLGTIEGATTVRQGTSSTQAIIAAIVGILIVMIAIGSLIVAILKP